MPNRPRKQKADPAKYAEKEYLTYDEAADFLGVRRSTLYTMITGLGIEPQKFNFDKKRYIAIADVKRMKEIREKPWLAGKDEKVDTIEEVA